MTEIEDILEAWAVHFERLATPTPKADKVKRDLQLINNIVKHSTKFPKTVTPEKNHQSH